MMLLNGSNHRSLLSRTSVIFISAYMYVCAWNMEKFICGIKRTGLPSFRIDHLKGISTTTLQFLFVWTLFLIRYSFSRLGGAMVTRSPLTAMTRVRVWLLQPGSDSVIHGMCWSKGHKTWVCLFFLQNVSPRRLETIWSARARSTASTRSSPRRARTVRKCGSGGRYSGGWSPEGASKTGSRFKI